MNTIYVFIYKLWQYIIYNYYTYTNQKYPFWMLQTFNNTIIQYSLKRDYHTQIAYNIRSMKERNEFIYNIFANTDIIFSFIPNTYPYNISDDIIHYILWINPDVDIYNISISSVILEHVNKLIPSAPFCFFKNSLSNKSIPEVDHYHVFIKLSR